MALFLVTAPAIEPVSLAEAKAHCRVDVADEDALIDTLRVAARQYVETFTRRPLITQTWDDKRDGFPCGSDEALELPLPPVSSITSVTYTATDGTSTVWSSALYTTDLPTGPKAEPARIVPIYGEVYPTTRSVINNVVIRFVAGYGSTAATVPASLRAAIKLLIGHWYERREPVNVGNIVTPIPLSIESLLWPYRAF